MMPGTISLQASAIAEVQKFQASSWFKAYRNRLLKVLNRHVAQVKSRISKGLNPLDSDADSLGRGFGKS